MKTNLQADDLTKDILFMLIDHFNYSIRDVNSYDELTEDEKLIIPRDTFNKITNIPIYESKNL